MASYNTATAAYVHGCRRLRDPRRRLLAQHARRGEAQPGRAVVTEQLANELTDQTPATRARPESTRRTSTPTRPRRRASPPRRQSAARRPGSSRRTTRRPTSRTSPSTVTSPYAATRRHAKISSTTAYVDPNQTNWEGTGAAYVAKTGETVTDRHHRPEPPRCTTSPRATSRCSSSSPACRVTQLATSSRGRATLGSTPSAVGAAGYTTPQVREPGHPRA